MSCCCEPQEEQMSLPACLHSFLFLQMVVCGAERLNSLLLHVNPYVEMRSLNSSNLASGWSHFLGEKANRLTEGSMSQGWKQGGLNLTLQALEGRKGGGEGSSGTMTLSVTPFKIHILFHAFFFSVTIGPSWCLVGCCGDCVSELAEFHSKWQRVKDSVWWKSLGGKPTASVCLSCAQLEHGTAKCLTRAHKAPHFGLAYQRNISF